LIRPASTSRRSPRLSALDLPSKSRKLENTTGGGTPCAFARRVKPREASDAPSPAMKPRRLISRSIRRAIERTSGVQQPQPACWIGRSSAGVHENIEDLGGIKSRAGASGLIYTRPVEAGAKLGNGRRRRC